jgi:serine/threonine protein kinase
MAQIYLARQLGPEGFEKLLVVKRILPHLAENEDFISMFLDEARIAARLSHPNIVQIFDLGAQDDSYFIAMEYIHGEDVRRVSKQAEQAGEPIPIPLICRVIIEACAGLDYAHKRVDTAGKPLNIVHRDISPQNILVSFEGGVKIVDFGIAKAADQATVTRSGVLKGKYSYMSPEQAAGQEVDSRTDVFALGIVLYELLTGTRLFKRATDIQTLNAVGECRVAPPTEIDHRIPEALGEITMKALAKDRGQRYAEARQLGAALEGWLLREGLPSSASHLAEFLQRIYAERLAREREEGRLLIESADASLSEEPERATPSQVSKGRATRTGRGAPAETRVAREPDATAAERPAGKSESNSRPRSRPSLPQAPEREPAPGTRPRSRPSLPPAEERSSPAGRGRVVAGAVGLLAAAAALTWWAVGGGGQVRVTSKPAGAVVLERGVERCRTPCALEGLAAGRHELTLRAPGHLPVTVPVEVPRAGAVEIPRVELEVAAPPDAGAVEVAPVEVALIVESEPAGATVRLGEREVGRTPWRGAVTARERLTLTLELPGRVTQSERFVVGDAPEETHRFTLPLDVIARPEPARERPVEAPRATGTVRFVVKPWATVSCGAAFEFGDTPFADQQMPAGDHRCTFTHPDFGQKTVRVHVDANALVKVPVAFP